MSPEKAKKRLKDFLLSRDELRNKIILETAENKILKIRQIAGRRTDEPPVSQEELLQYVSAHFAELNAETEKILDDLCDEILPEKNFTFILKQAGLLAVFLLPAIKTLVDCIVSFHYQAVPQTGLIMSCSVSILFLLAAVVAAVLVTVTGTKKQPKE